MDARVIRTRRDLSYAFLSLLDTKDYDSIKVIDICKQAMISKVTFYNNFKNKSELLNHILLVFEENIKKDIFEAANFKTKKDMILAIVKISYKNILKNSSTLKKILSTKSTSSVLIDLRNFINNEILRHIESLQSDEKSSIPKDYFAAFYSGAIVSILPMVLSAYEHGESPLDEDSLIKLFTS